MTYTYWRSSTSNCEQRNNATAPLQTCAGLTGGIEASIHAMRRRWEDEDTEAILFVDAANAFNAEVLSEICKDVKFEPQLLPLTGEILPAGSNTADNARTDISAVGLWQPLDRAHLDVKVFNHLAQSNAVKDLQKVYSQHQRSKKREYNARILEVERASFTPVIFS